MPYRAVSPGRLNSTEFGGVGIDVVHLEPMTAALLWVVDDDADDRWLMQQAWRQVNGPWRLRLFQGADQVVATLQTPFEAPHLVLIDYTLPGMNGYELTNYLQTVPQLRRTTFLWMSNGLTRDWESQAQELAVPECFIKPTLYADWQALVQRLDRYGPQVGH